MSNQHKTLKWEVRYNSDIAGRALHSEHNSETAALRARLDLMRSFIRHGLASVAATVTVGMITVSK